MIPASRPRRSFALLPALCGLLLAGASGCAVSPPIAEDLPRARGVQQADVLDDDYVPFRRAPSNHYALLMSGRVFQPPADGSGVATADDLTKGEPIDDPWVRGDMDNLSRLLLAKGWDVYRLDMGRVTPAALRALLDRIASVSDADTQVLVAYSGEGDSKGLRTRSMLLGPARHLVPQGVTITPPDLFAALEPVRGHKAVVLNACEGGVFADAARDLHAFDGVVITACPKGFATTPNEPTGTTAIMASFLGLYSDDPAKVVNLREVELDRAGGFFTNLAHRLSTFWALGSKPLSYDPVIFAGGDFWL
jgi:hypothetical protein